MVPLPHIRISKFLDVQPMHILNRTSYHQEPRKAFSWGILMVSRGSDCGALSQVLLVFSPTGILFLMKMPLKVLKQAGEKRDCNYGNIEVEISIKPQSSSDTTRTEVEDSDESQEQSQKVIHDELNETDDQLADYQLARDRWRREIRLVQRFGFADIMAHALMTELGPDLGEPSSYQEPMESEHKDKWFQAMEEMDSLTKNQTWKLVRRPPQQKLIGCRWIFKQKEGVINSRLDW